MSEPPGERASRPAGRRGRRRLYAGATALAAHLALIAALLRTGASPPAEPPPMAVSLVRIPIAPPPPPPPPATPPPKAQAAAPAPPAAARPAPLRAAPPPDIPPRLVPAAPTPAPPPPEPQVGAAELAGALTAESEAAGGGDGRGAGEGGGAGAGGRCDMVRRLQAALRGDAGLSSRVAKAQGGVRAVLVWNGDWVRRGDEEGKGLAGVRQAISVEVAFAPRPCREQPMRGLVLLSLADGPGAPKVVLGASAWRWSDLLSTRR